MKRTSKYLGKQFGNWTCTYVGVATVQARHKMNGKGLAKRPGHCNYYYCFTRNTSDGLAMKNVRLNSAQAARVFKGLLTVEEVANRKLARKSKLFVSQTQYTFK